MPHQRICLVSLSGRTAFGVLAAILLTLHPCTGQSQDKPPQLVATVGDNIILSCYLKPLMDASEMQLVWARTDLSPAYVHVWDKNKERVDLKHSSYMGRTSLSIEKMKHGDISLNISQVKLSDEGTYSCLVPSLGRQSFVQLIVGSVSSPVINMTINSSVVVLQCESKCWYPEPELFWLDGEGNLLSAGPTETVRGPDDLYTVSSRVTVEKRHNSIFTCRVQQKNINQTRETHIIIVSCDFFMDPFSAVVIAVCCFMCIIAVVVVVVVQNQRRNTIVRNDTTMHLNDGTEQTQQENHITTFINEAKLDVKETRDQTTVELLEYDRTLNDLEKDPKEIELLQKKEQTETQDGESVRSEAVRCNEKNEKREKKTRKGFCYK